MIINLLKHAYDISNAHIRINKQHSEDLVNQQNHTVGECVKYNLKPYVHVHLQERSDHTYNI